MAYYGGNQPPVYPPQSPVYPPQNYQQGGGYPPPSQQWYPPQQQQQPGYPSQPPPFPHLHSPTKQPSSPPFDPGPTAPGYGAAFAGGASDTRLNDGHSRGGFHPEKFNSKPKYNDVWAAVLFVVHLVAFAYVSYLGLGALKNGSTRQNGAALFADTAVIVVLLFSAVIGFVLSAAYFLLIERHAAVMIKATFIVSITINFVFALLLIATGALIGGIVSLAFAGLYLMCWFWWRSRIPFATIILETVTSVSKKYKGMFGVAILGLVLEIAYSVYFGFTLAGIILYTEDPPSTCRIVQTNKGTREECPSNTKRVALMLFALFSYYWVSQVIKSVVHVTNSGVFAAYYFLEGSPQGVPSSPALGSLKRATTTSFGSVCFGSLIIAVLRTAKAIVRGIASDTDNSCAVFCAMCLVCLLDWIESLVQYFNHYAYTQVAIYGKDFRTAAKDTWTMIKDRGIEAIINDNLIDNVLTIGSLLVGALTALLVYAYIAFAGPPFSANSDTILLVELAAFLFGFTMMNLVGEIITSGTATTFVALAEDPEALARTKPQLYEKIRQTYPEVAVGI